MTAPEKNLTARQQTAIAVLLVAPSVRQAAARLNLAEKTVRRWLEQPAFAEALRDAQERQLAEAVSWLRTLMKKAVAALARNLTSPKASDQIRAARVLLGYALQGHDLTAHHERIAELERRLQVQQGPRLMNGRGG